MKKNLCLIMLVILLSSCGTMRNLAYRASCSILELENTTITDIERFGPAISSMSLASCLTFTDTQYTEEMILNKFPYETASFLYVVNNHCGSTEAESISCEKILLSVTYSNSTFEKVIDYIKGRKGFNENIKWSYGSFVCNLNTEEYYNHRPDGSYYNDDDLYSYTKFTEVSLDSDTKEIKWINFVAISEERSTINFVGLYYHDYYGGYRFTEWSEFFDEFFSFYDWI